MKIRRRLFAPEVIQSSAMDCGPAALKSLLEGFGISASYGRLREACQTDVDGTSIDTLEEVAVQLGLDAEQIMLPLDHLLIEEARALPGIVVVRQPNGVTHFVVAWRKIGGLVQLMDPASGRRWPARRGFLQEVYVHAMPVPATAWREWAGSEEFGTTLRRRLERLGMGGQDAERLLEDSRQDPTWRGPAALDAAVRMTQELVDASGIAQGGQAVGVLRGLFKRVREGELGPDWAVPRAYWTVLPAESPEQVLFRGAVVVRVKGRKKKEESGDRPAPLPLELAAALQEPSPRPGRDLLRLVRSAGIFVPTLLLVALLMASAGVLFEALLFRGLLDLAQNLQITEQRLGAAAAILIFLTALLLLELPIASGIVRIGRHLETRLRIAFLRKIPRLRDRYFQSRLMSDMAERSHSVHFLRGLPLLAEEILRSAFALLLTTAGILWLDPSTAPLAVPAALVVVLVPLLFHPALAERDLRVRSHTGALSRFYLDSLLGLIPIRAHGAERSVRREHEGLLVEWARSGLSLQRAAVWAQGIQALVGFSVAAAILLRHVSHAEEGTGVLLLTYWALQLPVLGQQIAVAVRQIPAMRNVTLRLLEPLSAPEERIAEGPSETTIREGLGPVRIEMRGVHVRAAGHTILEEIDLSIERGSHVAIVGPSGAGKSSLVGLLLGWHRPAAGSIRVDGEDLDAERLDRLRKETAWVDPAVQLWNRSLLENLRYGSSLSGSTPIAEAVEAANLRPVLERMPVGLQTSLGEGGGLVSGGEGQRVRLGRAFLRRGVRLVILDEPFRGLDREQRGSLLRQARERWKGTTLLCITHDVGETGEFERAIVVEGGRVVEDGPPQSLLASPTTRYRALYDAEEEVRSALWSGSEWRRLRLEEGCLSEGKGP